MISTTDVRVTARLSTRLITRPDEAYALARELAHVPRVALDLESDGLFAYHAGICLMQLAWGGDDAHIAIVDPLASADGARAASAQKPNVVLAALAGILGDEGPIKVVHDIAFDSRLIAEAGLVIGNVHDTSIAARMLGQTSTGLASVLELALGVRVSKALQHHDWRLRPLTEDMLAYLSSDVAHLEKLDDKLFGEARARGIEDEVLEETRHRIASSALATSTPDPRPPYARLKGIERVTGPELSIARRLAEVREREAARRDVPPHKVMPAEALLAVARSRPANVAQLLRMRGVPMGNPDAESFAEEVLRAVAAGMTDGEIPEAERALLRGPRVPPEVQKARRARESLVMAWRKAEAKRRGVDDQVVLPGHCVKDIAQLEGIEGRADLARVPGIGAFRVTRDGDAILRALRGEALAGGDAAAAAPAAEAAVDDADGTEEPT